MTPDRPWKSVSAETTYAEDLRDLAAIHAELGRLAGRVAASLQGKELRARTVTIKVRYDDFSTVTRSHTDDSPTCDAGEIGQRAILLLGRTEAGTRPVRLLGVGTHGLAENGDGGTRQRLAGPGVPGGRRVTSPARRTLSKR